MLKINPFTGKPDIVDSNTGSTLTFIELSDDPAVLADVTDEANWDDDSGFYIGPTDDLEPGGAYFDNSTKIAYWYDGTTLIRWRYNNIFV